MTESDVRISFYLLGRSVKSLSRIKKYVDDPDEIAAAIENGAIVRKAIGDAADRAGAQVRGDNKLKKKILEEHKDELVDCDLTAKEDVAWVAYCQGMSDELAHAIEVDVLDALEGVDEDDEDDEDEEEEEEEEGEDGDDRKGDGSPS